MGYAGGKGIPTYTDLGWHSEAIQVDYDPNIISYDELLGLFFKYHNPTLRPFAQRVKSIIFTGNDLEAENARKRVLQLSELHGKGIFTEVKPLEKFYLAEDEHQFRYLKSEVSLYAEVMALYPTMDEQLASSVVSKLNAAALGYIEDMSLQALIKKSSISSEGAERLRAIHDSK